MIFSRTFGILALMIGLTKTGAAATLVTNASSALHRGVWQIELAATEAAGDPFFDVTVQVVFTRPDRSEIKVDTFFRGDKTWVGRAYCDQVGRWTWRSVGTVRRLFVVLCCLQRGYRQARLTALTR